MDYKYLLPVIGPVVAAIIASIIAFVVAVLSKESKISEFRRDWIESLRQESADYLSTVMFMMADVSFAERKGEDVQELISARSEQVIKLHSLHFSIVLRLRLSEHKKIIDLFDKLDDSADQGYEACKLLVEKIRIELPMLLDLEWERVKAGEPLYQMLKKYAVVTLACGVTILAGVIGFLLFKNI